MQHGFPFSPADRWTFPGGYPILYITDDGESLCADCVNDADNPVHMGGEADGWRIDGIQALEEFETLEQCAHCGRPF